MIRVVRIRPVGVCLAVLSLPSAGAAWAGETRCWIDNGAVVAPAAYGPIAGDFIVDLSSAKSQLHATAAQTVGWTNDHAHRTLRLAGETAPGFSMAVADLDARTRGFPSNIAGVLGADLLDRFTLDLDFDPCRLRLTRDPARRLPGAHGLRTRTIAGAPAVYAAISDGVTSRQGWFAVDTASAGSRIADAGLSRALPKGVDAGDRERPPARLRAVSVGGMLIEQTPAGLMSPVAPGLSGAFGVTVWSRFHLRADRRRGRVEVFQGLAGPN